MTTPGQLAPTRTSQSPPTGGDAAPARPEDRGSITIERRVVEKMAAQVVGEVDQVGGAARRLMGVPAGREDPNRAPQVQATVNGLICSLQVRLSVYYPASVTQVTERVRRRVIDRLDELAGMQVRRVDIIVTALQSPHSQVRVVE